MMPQVKPENLDADLRALYDAVPDPAAQYEIRVVAGLLDEAQMLTAQGDHRGMAATQHAMRRLLLLTARVAAHQSQQ